MGQDVNSLSVIFGGYRVVFFIAAGVELAVAGRLLGWSFPKTALLLAPPFAALAAYVTLRIDYKRLNR